MPHPIIDRIIRALVGNAPNQLLLFPEILDDLLPDDGRLSLDLVRNVAAQIGRPASGAICPKAISHFVQSMLHNASSSSLLDPWAGIGSLIIPTAESLGTPSVVHAIEPNLNASTLGQELGVNIGAQWATCNPIDWLKHTTQLFDLIVCKTHLAPGMESTTIVHDGQRISIHDKLGSLVLLHSCLRMSDQGQGIFIVPPSFIAPRQATTVYNNLNRLGFCLDAYIYIQSSVFARTTMTPAALVVIRRGLLRDVFVGELTTHQERNELLAENLRNRRPAQTLGLGAIVASNDFRGFQPLVAEQRVRTLARGLPWTPSRLGSLSHAINRLQPRRQEHFDDRPNSIYVSLIGLRKVSASIADLPETAHNWVQIVLDPEKAIASYVAGFLNTSLGEAVREQVAIEGFNRCQLLRRSVADILVYLPSVQQQLLALNTQTHISTLTSELSDLEHQLWNRPLALNDVVNGVTQVNRQDRFTDWLDTLPFPLATILWAYHASGDDYRRRYEHLLHLFEALTEFFATVLLSGFVNSSTEGPAALSAMRTVLEQSHLSIGRSTFGAWVRIVESLSKSAHSLTSTGRPTFLAAPNTRRATLVR